MKSPDLSDEAYLLEVAAECNWRVIAPSTGREFHFVRPSRFKETYEIEAYFTRNGRLRRVRFMATKGRGESKRLLWAEELGWFDSLKREETARWLRRYGVQPKSTTA